MSSADPVPRRAGRVLVLDPAGRVLLENVDPARPGSRFWVTIGGGIDAGEDAPRQQPGNWARKPALPPRRRT